MANKYPSNIPKPQNKFTLQRLTQTKQLNFIAFNKSNIPKYERSKGVLSSNVRKHTILEDKPTKRVCKDINILKNIENIENDSYFTRYSDRNNALKIFKKPNLPMDSIITSGLNNTILSNKLNSKLVKNSIKNKSFGIKKGRFKFKEKETKMLVKKSIGCMDDKLYKLVPNTAIVKKNQEYQNNMNQNKRFSIYFKPMDTNMFKNLLKSNVYLNSSIGDNHMTTHTPTKTTYTSSVLQEVTNDNFAPASTFQFQNALTDSKSKSEISNNKSSYLNCGTLGHDRKHSIYKNISLYHQLSVPLNYHETTPQPSIVGVNSLKVSTASGQNHVRSLNFVGPTSCHLSTNTTDLSIHQEAKRQSIYRSFSFHDSLRHCANDPQDTKSHTLPLQPCAKSNDVNMNKFDGGNIGMGKIVDDLSKLLSTSYVYKPACNASITTLNPNSTIHPNSTSNQCIGSILKKVPKPYDGCHGLQSCSNRGKSKKVVQWKDLTTDESSLQKNMGGAESGDVNCYSCKEDSKKITRPKSPPPPLSYNESTLALQDTSSAVSISCLMNSSTTFEDLHLGTTLEYTNYADKSITEALKQPQTSFASATHSVELITPLLKPQPPYHSGFNIGTSPQPNISTLPPIPTTHTSHFDNYSFKNVSPRPQLNKVNEVLNNKTLVGKELGLGGGGEGVDGQGYEDSLNNYTNLNKVDALDMSHKFDLLKLRDTPNATSPYIFMCGSNLQTTRICPTTSLLDMSLLTAFDPLLS